MSKRGPHPQTLRVGAPRCYTSCEGHLRVPQGLKKSGKKNDTQREACLSGTGLPCHHPQGVMNKKLSAARIRSAVTRTGRVIWLPLVVFTAFELSVPADISIFRSRFGTPDNHVVVHGPDTPLHPVSPAGPTRDNQASEHAYFGLDDDTSTNLALNDVEDRTEASTALGVWSGRFAGILIRDRDTGCWSAYDFDLHLRESQEGLSGSGSYWVDPASCSLHTEKAVAFIDAVGVRNGNRVSIDLQNSDRETELVFEGLLMRDRLAGWFYLSDGKPVSGPVVLARK